ncbi:MAG: hypothetical protein ACLSFT_02970 [Ruminococcus callidus]
MRRLFRLGVVRRVTAIATREVKPAIERKHRRFLFHCLADLVDLAFHKQQFRIYISTNQAVHCQNLAFRYLSRNLVSRAGTPRTPL